MYIFWKIFNYNLEQRWEDFESDESEEYVQEQQDDVLDDPEIIDEYLKFTQESKNQNQGDNDYNNRRGGKRGGRGGGKGQRGDRDNNRGVKNNRPRFDPDSMIRMIKNAQAPYIFYITNVSYQAKIQDIQDFYSELQIQDIRENQKGSYSVETNSMDEAIRLVNLGLFSIHDRQINLKFDKQERQREDRRDYDQRDERRDYGDRREYIEKRNDKNRNGFTSSKKIDDRQPIRKQQPYNRRKGKKIRQFALGSEDDYDDFGLKIIEKEKEIKERKPLVFINRKKDAQEPLKQEENEENKSKQNPFGQAKPVQQQAKESFTTSTEKPEKLIQENTEKYVEQKEIKKFNNRNKQQKVEQKEETTTTTTVSEKKLPQKSHFNKFDILEDDE